jgi:ATP-binding cassette subfamily C (CFTR/MRP) protein 1
LPLSVVFSVRATTKVVRERAIMGAESGEMTSGKSAASAQQQQAFGAGRIGLRNYAPSLYDSAGPVQRLTFAWISDLVARGYAAQLEENDLPDLPSVEQAEGVAALARQYWREELAADGDPQLVRSLRRIVQRDCCLAAFAELIKVALQFCGPVITNVLVVYIEETQSGTRARDWTPWGCALAMCIMPALAGIAKVHQTNMLTNVGIRLKTAMTALVFEKSVLLSAEGRGVCPKGEMINLVANDAEKVMMTAVKFNSFWSAPVTVAVCLVLLSLEIGAGAAFAGFAMLWVGFVLLGLIFANIGRLKREERNESDKRVTKMGELLRGIKILKLCESPLRAWHTVHSHAPGTTISDSGSRCQLCRLLGRTNGRNDRCDPKA